MRAEPRIIGLRRVVRVPAAGGAAQGDVDDELRFHLESREEDLVAQGCSRPEAHERAMREFGDADASRAELLAVDRRRQMKAWVADLAPSILRDGRSALRQIGKAPLLTVALILVLGVGVGGTTAAFSITRGFTARSAPGIVSSDDLVRLTMVYSKTAAPTPIFRYADYRALLSRTDAFARIGGWEDHESSISISADGHFGLAGIRFVTDGYFPTLELPMALGQGFGSIGTFDAVATRQVVLSYDFWHQTLDGDQAVVGKTIALNGLPFKVVGVGPKGFNGMDADDRHVDAFVPRAAANDLVPWMRGNPESNQQLNVFARLRTGVSRTSAAAIASAVVQQQAMARGLANWNRYRRQQDSLGFVDDHGPTLDHMAIQVGPLSAVPPTDPSSTTAMRDESRTIAIVSVLILLIACANASSLLLGSAARRRREIAFLLSLGAPRVRLIRQLLTESIVLGVASFVPALALAAWLTHVGVSRYSSGFNLAPDRLTAVAGLGIAVVAGALVGVIPALHATRAQLTAALKEGISGLDRRGSRWQNAFTVVQIALAAVFVGVTGLSLGMISESARPQFGVQHDDALLSAQLDFTVAGLGPSRTDSVLSVARERVARIPGVVAVGSTTGFPLLGQTLYVTLNSTEGPDGPSPATPDTAKPTVVRVDPGLFATGALQIQSGRPLTAADVAGSAPVAVVSAALARQLWPGTDPIGRELVNQTRVPILMYWKTATVVGVASDVSVDGDAVHPTKLAYLALHQFPDTETVALLMRTSGPPARLVDSVQRALSAVNSKVLVHDVRTYRALENASVTSVSDALKTMGLPTLAALLLACLGVYAVIALRVSYRAREIGIRIALGASARRVESQFVLMGVRLGLLGGGIGAAIVYYIGQRDAHVILLGVTIFAVVIPAVIAFAAWLPARRATRVDPALALRAE